MVRNVAADKDKTLTGRKVLVTRERSQAQALSSMLRLEGAQPVECPLIAFEPPSDWTPADRCLDILGQYAGIFFSSTNAVRFFFERIDIRGDSREQVGRVPCYAIGPATAKALSARDIAVMAVPEEYQAEGLVELMKGEPLQGKRFLLPRARQAREILPEFLESNGALVDVAVVYETTKAQENRFLLLDLLAAGDLDYLTFTSPSTVRYFIEFLSADSAISTWKEIPAACLGPVTAEAAGSAGLKEIIVPPQATLSALVRTIVDHDQRQKQESL